MDIAIELRNLFGNDAQDLIRAWANWTVAVKEGRLSKMHRKKTKKSIIIINFFIIYQLKIER